MNWFRTSSESECYCILMADCIGSQAVYSGQHVILTLLTSHSTHKSVHCWSEPIPTTALAWTLQTLQRRSLHTISVLTASGMSPRHQLAGVSQSFRLLVNPRHGTPKSLINRMIRWWWWWWVWTQATTVDSTMCQQTTWLDLSDGIYTTSPHSHTSTTWYNIIQLLQPGYRSSTMLPSLLCRSHLIV